MKTSIIILFLLMLISCGHSSNDSDNSPYYETELYNSFDKANHLQPNFDKKRFDTLHSWDLGLALLEPINKTQDKGEEEIKLSHRLSPGQKALYFYWYLNDEVTNGGFIQFYWNSYRKYLPPLKDGLKLIGDSAMLSLVENVDKEYQNNVSKFDLQKQKNDWSPLYDSLKVFDKFDSIFYKIQNKAMELIEIYARNHPEEFIKLK